MDYQERALLKQLGAELESPIYAYDPDQPRAPAGQPDGGQWVGEGGGGSGGAVSPKDFSKNPPTGDSGYAYHATNEERLKEIASSGSLETHPPDYGTDQSSWPDGSEQERSYWTDKPSTAVSFAPEEGKSVLVRMQKEGKGFKQESTGDLYLTKDAATDKLEYLGEDDAWHPVDKLAESSKGSSDAGGKSGMQGDASGLKHYLDMTSGMSYVNKLILENGKEYQFNEKSFVGGRPQECYRNAALAAMAGEGAYVEGFIDVYGVPIQHAWIDDGGIVKDVTLKSSKGIGGYYGVPVKEEFLLRTLNETKTYGVFQYTNHELLSKAKPADIVGKP